MTCDEKALDLGTWVVGDERAQGFVISDAGAVIDISDWDFELQANSADLPDFEISAAGDVTDGPAGKCAVDGFGKLITLPDMLHKKRATFTGRLVATDGDGVDRYSRPVTWCYVLPPLES